MEKHLLLPDSLFELTPKVTATETFIVDVQEQANNLSFTCSRPAAMVDDATHHSIQAQVLALSSVQRTRTNDSVIICGWFSL